jgi:hypothetical protein
MGDQEQEFKKVAVEFQHTLTALMDTTRTLNDSGVNPAVLVSATCANYVGFVTTMGKLVGLSEQEAFDTCLGGLHQMRQYVAELYKIMDEGKAAA